MLEQNVPIKSEMIHAKKESGALIKDVINYIVENQKLQDEVDKLSRLLEHKHEVAALRVVLCIEFGTGSEEVKSLLRKHKMDMENRSEDVERALRRFGLYGRLVSGTGKRPASDEGMEDDNNIDAKVEAALCAYDLIQKERMEKKVENAIELWCINNSPVDDEDAEDASGEDSDAYR
ncbi:hypothetical protein K488DRAFT_75060 [Vararia minispora EC-137]|uniref:Uncharacterized protein n=1 Tax=Vararia minispora EC-137 TaxID=1314806 RepID=A0ACB8Q4U8_9AGAM|nr:hypothetical protein K488DRAFT_75060 [Vararia minispora EC-137]